MDKEVFELGLSHLMVFIVFDFQRIIQHDRDQPTVVAWKDCYQPFTSPEIKMSAKQILQHVQLKTS